MKSAILVSDSNNDLEAGLAALGSRTWNVKWIKVIPSTSRYFKSVEEHPLSGFTQDGSLPEDPLASNDHDMTADGMEGSYCTCAQAIDAIWNAKVDLLIADLRWFQKETKETHELERELEKYLEGEPDDSRLAETARALLREDRIIHDQTRPGVWAVAGFLANNVEPNTERQKVSVILFSVDAGNAMTVLTEAGFPKEAMVPTAGSSALLESKASAVIGGILDENWPEVEVRPSDLRNSLETIEKRYSIPIHNLLSFRNLSNQSAASETEAKLREFLGVDQEAWESLAEAPLGLATAFKAVVGEWEILNGSGAWLTALAAFNSLPMKGSWGPTPFDIQQYLDRVHSLERLQLSAPRSCKRDRVELVDLFYEMCREMFPFEEGKDDREGKTRDGGAALEVVRIGAAGSLSFGFGFPWQNEGLGDKVKGYFTGREWQTEHTTALSIWRFVNAALVGLPSGGKVEIGAAGEMCIPFLCEGADRGTVVRWEAHEAESSFGTIVSLARADSRPSALVFDSSESRRRALAARFSDSASAFTCDPNDPCRLYRLDESGREKFEPSAPGSVTLLLRHLGDNRKHCLVGGSRVVYYGGESPPDSRFFSAEEASTSQALPAPPQDWTDGPLGFLLWKRLEPGGEALALGRQEAEEILDWAKACKDGEEVDLPDLLRPSSSDGEELLLALSVLCQGFLAVVARDTEASSLSEEVHRALDTMGWKEFSATELGQEVGARIDRGKPNVIDSSWWLQGLGDWSDDLEKEVKESPDLDAVAALLGRVRSGSVDPQSVAVAFLALWKHLEDL